MDHVESPVHLPCMTLECGRKLENLQRHKENVQTLVRKVPNLEINKLPSCCEAAAETKNKTEKKELSCSSFPWLALKPKRTCRHSLLLLSFRSIIHSNDQAWLPLPSFDLSLASQTSYLLKNVLWDVRECLSEVQMAIDGIRWHFKLAVKGRHSAVLTLHTFTSLKLFFFFVLQSAMSHTAIKEPVTILGQCVIWNSRSRWWR